MHVHKDSVNECENGAHHYSYSCIVSVIKAMAESDNLCKSFQILFVIVLLLIVCCSVLSLSQCQLTLVHKYTIFELQNSIYDRSLGLFLFFVFCYL